MDAYRYSAREILRDGRTILIRAQRPNDREAILAAYARASPTSMYHRFFASKRGLSEREADYFLNIDFVNHVVLLALAEEDGRPTIIGGARYIVVKPSMAEISFSILDEYQGKGIGGALLRHLVKVGREAGLMVFLAEVLADNEPMLKVFVGSGLPMTAESEGTVVHVTLRLVEGDDSSVIRGI